MTTSSEAAVSENWILLKLDLLESEQIKMLKNNYSVFSSVPRRIHTHYVSNDSKKKMLNMKSLKRENEQ